jgi:hypothetical protein
LQVFAGAKKAGYLPTDRTVRIDHVGFGLVMGEDGKKFRSRSGDVSGGEGWVPVAVREDWWAGWWGWCVGMDVVCGDFGRALACAATASHLPHPSRPAAHAAAFHMPPRGAAPGATAKSGT